MPAARPCPFVAIARWREALFAESGGQCVHDSLPRRPGWTTCFALECEGRPAGYGAVVAAGPWQGRPTIFEFHVTPEFRHQAFALFECFLAASGARHLEVQTNHALLTTILHAFGRHVVSEKIVFGEGVPTELPANGATLHLLTDEDDLHAAIEQRSGHGKWALRLGAIEIGSGELYFHYNAPYCDIAMQIAEPHRRQGYGSYFVQELKRQARALGAVPAARCDTQNFASRATVARAGMVPRGHILFGEI